MNASAGAAPQVSSGSRSPWPLRLVVLGVVLVVAAALFRSYHPFPSDEERQYFGWWYGSEMLTDSAGRTWAAEFAPNGDLRIWFGYYHRLDHDKPWEVSTNQEVGHWRVRNGLQQLVSDIPGRIISWPERIQRWAQSGSMHRRHAYRTTLINDHELRYTSILEGHEFHSLHSTHAVALPPAPLPPDQWPVTR